MTNWKEKFQQKYHTSVFKAYPEYIESHVILLKDIEEHITTLLAAQRKEMIDKMALELENNIGFLRQYLNERTSKKLITNEEIKTFIFNEKL